MYILIIFFFINSVSAQFCSLSTQCFNEHGICVDSQPGVTCTECNLQTYLLTNGTCAGDTSIFTTTRVVNQTVNSICNRQGYCQIKRFNQTAECVLSRYGVACLECNQGSGYINENQLCTCYDSQYDPAQACIRFSSVGNDVLLNFTYVKTKYTCDSFQSKSLGCFKQPSDFNYGKEPATIPNQCCVDFLGPKPNELTEQYGAPYEECNTYCAENPNSNSTSCVTCAGHGTWNSTTYSCTCDLHWKLRNIGIHPLDGSIARVCDLCQGYWGPLPDLDDKNIRGTVNYCSVPWFTDPIDGKNKECGGHGTSLNGICQCDSNIDLGFWRSVLIDNTYNPCIRCQPGYLGKTCTSKIDYTMMPTKSPTEQPPTATRSPTPYCTFCPDQDQGALFLASSLFTIQTLNTINSTICLFENVNYFIQENHWIVNFTAGIDTLLERNRFGWDLCRQYGEQCKRITWVEIQEHIVQYTFFVTDQFPVPISIQDTNVRLLNACIIPTYKPTRQPTNYPTNYN
jgi:hypothetical protein